MASLVTDEPHLHIHDERTGREYKIPIQEGNMILTKHLVEIKDEHEQPLTCMDAGYTNTIVCESEVSFIDGEAGILQYRGYDIDTLAQKCCFEEVAFLLIFGNLPSTEEFEDFKNWMRRLCYVPESIKSLIMTFPHNAHPMSILLSALSAVAAYNRDANPVYSGANVYEANVDLRTRHAVKVLAVMPSICGLIFRHRNFMSVMGVELAADENFSFAEILLCMMDRVHPKEEWWPNRVIVKALDQLFTLHAEHELNCSTAAVRHVASAGSDVYSSVAAGIAALYGPKHGGANEAAVRMIERIGCKENIPDFLTKVKRKEAKLMGFGHRVYKNHDPRKNVIVNEVAPRVFDVLGREPLIEVAYALERAALDDDYFKSRKLFPNVDFYTGLVYKAMGIDYDFFTVLFALPRVAGWIAHWFEYQGMPDKIVFRPAHRYVGPSTQTMGTTDNLSQTNPMTNDFLSTSEHRKLLGSVKAPWIARTTLQWNDDAEMSDTSTGTPTTLPSP